MPDVSCSVLDPSERARHFESATLLSFCRTLPLLEQVAQKFAGSGTHLHT